ncbi:hypothetical protein PAHAL_3G150300 [Panicum hallii]|nr:uncharacterized protein LOC112887626 isoform X2 [Panicum hallii]XP_025809637.1 uncharacterized protein LOC112887626 isoform X2 [Panicum hallii]PAN17700.1 hypothetical protein PAHAL_3G150300 [Panicum hallii]
MEPLPDIYPLTGLQIGDIQSYISRAFLYFAPLSKKVFILVDNQPWLSAKQSRSARLWQFMVTKYRMSPFANSRAKQVPTLAAAAAAASAAAAVGESDAMRRWFAVADLSRALHGFLVFEVSWRDVHGINYLNELLTDTSLALEARYMKKWEFYSAEQAAGCTHLWFLGRATEARALRGYLAALHAHSDPSEQLEECGIALRRTCSSSSLSAVSEDDDDGPAGGEPGHSGGMPRYSSEADYIGSPSASARARRARAEAPFVAPAQYSDTLILFRFRDSLLPVKLRQIIMSDIRLLTLLESGLPPWVIFFQSYPLLCQLYRPWMRPLVRSLYLLASLVTVLIGFYDLYKNVPLLKSAAARICGPLFGWIETWDMMTRIQYLGTILFLRNLRKCLQSLLALLRAAQAVLRAVAAPLADAAGPLLSACAELGGLVAEGLAPAWALLVDLAEVLWAPFDLVLDSVAGCLGPLLQVAMLPARAAAALAGCAGTLLSATYNFSKDIWETMSSIFELNHMSEAAQQSAFDMSQIKTLWNDLFSQIFRALRGILNGISVFFASCNRHRLSIYNHAQSRLRHMLRVTRLAPSSCRCKHRGRRRPGKNSEGDAVVECDVCK